MQEQLKIQAGQYTVDHFVQSGMVIGLGVGSTAIHAVRRLGEHLQSGRLTDIVGIPAADWIEAEALKLGIPLTDFASHPVIDLTFDGADEVDPQKNLIKGGGGALLREKIVAQASRQEIIMVDESKLVPLLGTTWAVPVEVIPFGLASHQRFLHELGGAPTLRKKDSGESFTTDNGNYILDTHFGTIPDPAILAQQLKTHAGIVEHGIFVGLATKIVVASPGGVRVID